MVQLENLPPFPISHKNHEGCFQKMHDSPVCFDFSQIKTNNASELQNAFLAKTGKSILNRQNTPFLSSKWLVIGSDSKTSRLAPDLSRHNLVSLKSKNWSKWVCVNDEGVNFMNKK